jgi:branched-subunit amino acid ABC-type transport system permease component
MVSQLIFNGLITGAIVALPALALTLIFGILRFPNFAIGAMLTLGAYMAWAANSLLGVPLALAAVFACVALGLVCAACDKIVFARLRDRDGITLLVASMGLAFVLENICRFAFGNDARNFAVPVARPVEWFGLRVNHEQLVIAISVSVCLALMFVLLRYTSLGRAMRAVADNAPLAAVRGIERERIAGITWMIAGAITALAGVLIGLDRAIDPVTGWNYQITTFAAAILGGLGNPLGAVIGALVIGVAEELSALIIPTNYRQAVAFLVIVILLLFRPHGLFGTKAIKK